MCNKYILFIDNKTAYSKPIKGHEYWNEYRNIQLCTLKEIMWFNECIKQNKVLPLESKINLQYLYLKIKN